MGELGNEATIKNEEAFTSTDIYSVLVITHPLFHMGKENPDREYLSYIVKELGLPPHPTGTISYTLQHQLGNRSFSEVVHKI